MQVSGTLFDYRYYYIYLLQFYLFVIYLTLIDATIKLAALDAYLGVVHKDYLIDSFDIPLKKCGDQTVRDFVNKVLVIKVILILICGN